jgi:hypothetical protein
MSKYYFYYVLIFFIPKYCYVPLRQAGVDFLEGVNIYAEKFLDIFCLTFIFCGPPKKEHTTILRKSHMSRLNDFLKYHRNVNKQTNPLQVDNLITYKSAEILQACRGIMNTACQNFSSSEFEKF